MTAGSISETFAALLLVAGVAGCTGGRPTRFEEDPFPEEMRLLYEWDAARLAFQEIQGRGHPARDHVELPPYLVNAWYRALGKVYGAVHIPERDSVFIYYQIHSYRVPELFMVIVRTNAACEWQSAAGETGRTGVEQVDRLMDEYGLRIRGAGLPCGEAGVVTFSSSRPLNTVALAERFERVPAVMWAEVDRMAGEGDRITGRSAGGVWELTFSVGSGDCPSGCGTRRYWRFKVEKSGRVSFVGSWGDPPPPPRPGPPWIWWFP